MAKILQARSLDFYGIIHNIIYTYPFDLRPVTMYILDKVVGKGDLVLALYFLDIQVRPAGTAGKIGKAKTFTKAKSKVSKAKAKQIDAAEEAIAKVTDESNTVTFVPERLSTKVTHIIKLLVL